MIGEDEWVCVDDRGREWLARKLQGRPTGLSEGMRAGTVTTLDGTCWEGFRSGAIQLARATSKGGGQFWLQIFGPSPSGTYDPHQQGTYQPAGTWEFSATYIDLEGLARMFRE